MTFRSEMATLRAIRARFISVPGQAVLGFMAFFAGGVLVTIWGVLADNVAQLIIGVFVMCGSAFVLWRAIPALLKMNLPETTRPSSDDVSELVNGSASSAVARVRAAIAGDTSITSEDRETAIRFVRKYTGRHRLFGWAVSAFVWAGFIASDVRAVEDRRHLWWIPLSITVVLAFIAWRSFRLQHQVRAWAATDLSAQGSLDE